MSCKPKENKKIKAVKKKKKTPIFFKLLLSLVAVMFLVLGGLYLITSAQVDSDGDGVLDQDEVAGCENSPDCDSDGICDGSIDVSGSGGNGDSLFYYYWDEDWYEYCAFYNTETDTHTQIPWPAGAEGCYWIYDHEGDIVTFSYYDSGWDEQPAYYKISTGQSIPLPLNGGEFSYYP